MENSNTIYLIFRCDEWKSTDKMVLLTATKSTRKLKNLVEDQIRSGDMTYDYGDKDKSVTDQIRLFRTDFRSSTISEMNTHLEYGYIEAISDGQIR